MTCISYENYGFNKSHKAILISPRPEVEGGSNSVEGGRPPILIHPPRFVRTGLNLMNDFPDFNSPLFLSLLAKI